MPLNVFILTSMNNQTYHLLNFNTQFKHSLDLFETNLTFAMIIVN